MVNGLTTAGLGKPDYPLACRQHEAYIAALKTCGLTVKILDPDLRFPDSVFVEDVALLTPAGAVLLNPGAATRRGEVPLIEPVLESLFGCREAVRSPGTVEGGDILMVGGHYYIGQSLRTNREGARQLKAILSDFGFSSSTISSKIFLHLKTAVAYLENNVLLITEEFQKAKDFSHLHKIVVEEEERYAANSIWVNGRVIMPAGFPKTQRAIEKKGYQVLPVDVSEFRKLDGGVSCLSLRI